MPSEQVETGALQALAPARLLRNWEEHKDPSGKTFYYNNMTKETSWDKSKGAAPPLPPVPGGLPANWKEEKDPFFGISLYYSKVTKERTLEKPAAQRVLGCPGWEEHIDPSGKTFYYDAVTKVTSWDKPLPSPPFGGGLANWEEHKDPSTGKTFYYNKVTKETSWDKPAAKRVRGCPNWEEHIDPFGKTFYYDTVTKVTSWEKPAAKRVLGWPPNWEEPIDPSGKTFYYDTVTKVTSWDKPLPLPPFGGGLANWEEHKDPSTGKTFYYNKVTKETSCQKPAAKRVLGCPNWEEHIDPSGKTFYYDTVTKETSWDKPAGKGVLGGPPNLEPALPDAVSRLKSEACCVLFPCGFVREISMFEKCTLTWTTNANQKCNPRNTIQTQFSRKRNIAG